MLRRLSDRFFGILGVISLIDVILAIGYGSAKYLIVPAIYIQKAVPYIHERWPAYEYALNAVLVALYILFLTVPPIMFALALMRRHRLRQKA